MSNLHTLHGDAQNRNTSISGSVRARNWMFTLNNYMDAEIKNLSSLEECEYVFQEELGEETKTPHLQGYLKFKQPKTLTGMKKINARAHWEIVKNVFAIKQYCIKLETRNGKIYTNMKEIEDKLGKTNAAIIKNEEHEEFTNDFETWKSKVIERSIREAMEEFSQLSITERKKILKDIN